MIKDEILIQKTLDQDDIQAMNAKKTESEVLDDLKTF